MTGAQAAPEVSCYFFSEREWKRESVAVPGEMALTIFVNGQELATVLCTPARLTHLVLGFLCLEGIIKDKREVASLRVCEEEPVADVRLTRDDFSVPARRVLTSGCGQGASFQTEAPAVSGSVTLLPQEVLSLMRQLYQRQMLFRHMGGIHSSALADRREILVQAEDIGRHNTLDKIMGECLLRGISTAGGILLTTGRVSSEMVLKAARMQAPVIVSRGSPTLRAIAIGGELGITIIGYARGERLSVFSNEERLLAGRD